MIREQEKQSTRHTKRKHQEKNKSGEKEEKETEEWSQESFSHKSKLKEGTCYFRGKPGHILIDFTEEAYNPKDKRELKTATHYLDAKAQKD